MALTAGLHIAAFQSLSSGTEWLGLILLTNAEGAASAGIYRTAFQICLLFTIVNSSFAIMLGPRLAIASAGKHTGEIRRTVRTASAMGTLLCLPLFATIMIVPEPILLLFGPSFAEGADALRILAMGQLINVAFGPVGTALTMMSREKFVLRIEIVADACAIALIVFALPRYGMAAAAAGSSLAAVVRNVLSYVVLRGEMRRL